MTSLQAVGWALLHFLYQGAILALLLRLVLSLLPVRASRVRYAASLATLFAMPGILLLTITLQHVSPGLSETVVRQPQVSSSGVQLNPTGEQVSSINPAATDPPVNSISADPGPPALSFGARLNRLLPFLVALWLVGFCIAAARQSRNWMRARRLTTEGLESAPELWGILLQRLRQRLGIRREVQLWSSTRAAVPAIVGWIKPVILLPASALSGLTVPQVELLLAHELCHVRRWDYLVNLLQSAIETLLYYHPAVWWVSAQVRQEREHCCDDLAVALTGDALPYAEALVAMEELRSLSVPNPALAATGGSLLTRVRRLVEPEGDTELVPRWSAVLLLGAGLIMGLAGIRLAAQPNLASPASALQDDSKLVAKKHKQPAEYEARFDTAGMGPDTVIRHPDPTAALERRLEWAHREARGYQEYWVGYSIQSLFPGGNRSLYMGRIRGGLHINDMVFTGKLVNFGDLRQFGIPGVQILRLVGGDPAQVAVLLRVRKGLDGGDVQRIYAISVELPADFERRPLLWLGSASDSASLNVLQKLERRAGPVELRSDMVGVMGAHRSSDLVVPILVPRLKGDAAEPVRVAAAEWLGRHGHPQALSALAHAARKDRASVVRREAAESVGDVPLPQATDTLIQLARTLEDREARREAVEALAQREENRALTTLLDLARNDPDREIRVEAVETIGDFDDKRGVQELLTIARENPHEDARREAVETYGGVAEPEVAVVELERIARRPGDGEVAGEAVETLGDLENSVGLPALERILRDHPESEVRREAAETIGELAPERALPVLRRSAFEDRSEDVQAEAVETMGGLHDPRALETLLSVIREHPQERVQREAVETLGELEGGSILTELERIAKSHPVDGVRAEAVETYGDVASATALVEFVDRLFQQELPDQVREEGLEVLADSGTESAVALLIRLARNHPNREVRRSAIQRLGDTDSPAAESALRKMLERD